MQIYFHFVKHVCMELWFVWEYSNIVRYVEHDVSFLNEYVNYCPCDYRQSEVQNIFYGWLFVSQEFSAFSHSVLVLLYFCLDITLKVLRSKCGKTIRLNVEQVSFSTEFFKHVKNFTATLFQNTILWLVPALHKVFWMFGMGSPEIESAHTGPVITLTS